MILIIIGTVLQIAGTAVITSEAFQAMRRWRSMFGNRTHAASGTARSTTEVRGRATGRRNDEGLTCDERIDRLREDLEQQIAGLHHQVDNVRASIPAAAAQAAADVEKRLQPQIADTLAYLAGQGHRHRLMPWWLGPALLIIGLLVTIIGTLAMSA